MIRLGFAKEMDSRIVLFILHLVKITGGVINNSLKIGSTSCKGDIFNALQSKDIDFWFSQTDSDDSDPLIISYFS